MPPRKSDHGRKSDTSGGRFVPLEDDFSVVPQAPAPPLVPATAPAPAPAPAPSSSFVAVNTSPMAFSASASSSVLAPPAPPAPPPSSSSAPIQAHSDKGKEKEREKDGKDGAAVKEGQAISIEELQLPKSIITRLAKGVLPPNTQIQANAVLAMSKSATVFISHLANAANEITALQNKKTIMPHDVFKALDDIDFGIMRERVEAEFAKFNEVQTSKRSTYRKKVAAARKAAAATVAGADAPTVTDGDITMVSETPKFPAADSASGQPPRSKKARTDGAEGHDPSRMDVDDPRDVSDVETVQDEPEEDDGEDDEEEEEEEEDDDDDDVEAGADEEERDELEEREDKVDEDEALDDADDSE